eukprot:jgi/Mesen1/9836/ME000070S09123
MELLTFVSLYLFIMAAVLFLLLFGESAMFEGTVHSFTAYGRRSIMLDYGTGPTRAQAQAQASGSCSKALVEEAWASQSDCLGHRMFYMGILAGGYYCFAEYCCDSIPGPFLSSAHLIAAPLWVLASLAAFFLTSFCDPGTVTAGNVERHLASFRYDGIIYEEKACTTCSVQRQAGRPALGMRACSSVPHIAECNNCIGENNVRYFVAFLALNWGMCAYGVYLLLMIVRGEVRQRRVVEAILAASGVLYDSHGKERAAQARDWLPTLTQQYGHITMLLLLLVLLLTFKWMDYRRWAADDANSALERQALASAHARVHNESQSSDLTDPAAAEKDLPLKGLPLEAARSSRQAAYRVNAASGGSSRGGGEGEGEGEVEWVHPGEIEVDNSYNRGVWENVKEVFWPLSQRTVGSSKNWEHNGSGGSGGGGRRSTGKSDVGDSGGRGSGGVTLRAGVELGLELGARVGHHRVGGWVGVGTGERPERIGQLADAPAAAAGGSRCFPLSKLKGSMPMLAVI